jgi:hypothetical protein
MPHSARRSSDDEERLNREQHDPPSHHRRMNMQKYRELGRIKECMKLVSARETDNNEKYDRYREPYKEARRSD